MSAIPLTSLDLDRGTTGEWSIVIRDSDTNQPMNLTGCTLAMHVSKAVTVRPDYAYDADEETTPLDTDLDLTSPSAGITVDDANTGAITITISKTQSAGLYPDFHYFEVSLTNPSSETYTVARGYLNVTE